MLIKVYDERILVPLKNGSRYIGRKFTETDSFTTDCIEKKSFPAIDTIIIRNPMESLISGLHTDIISHINDCGTELHNINIQSTIDTCLNNKSVHWSPHLNKWLYRMWLRNTDIQIIDVNELTNWLELPYNSKEYDFHDLKYWVDKETIWDLCKTKYIHLWDILQIMAIQDMVWYNKLKNRKVETIKII